MLDILIDTCTQGDPGVGSVARRQDPSAVKVAHGAQAVAYRRSPGRGWRGPAKKNALSCATRADMGNTKAIETQ